MSFSSFKLTCIATGKSFCASGGKNTSTAFFWNAWFPDGGLPTSIMCNFPPKKSKQIADEKSAVQFARIKKIYNLAWGLYLVDYEQQNKTRWSQQDCLPSEIC